MTLMSATAMPSPIAVAAAAYAEAHSIKDAAACRLALQNDVFRSTVETTKLDGEHSQRACMWSVHTHQPAEVGARLQRCGMAPQEGAILGRVGPAPRGSGHADACRIR
jgi:hypothetical protein